MPLILRFFDLAKLPPRESFCPWSGSKSEEYGQVSLLLILWARYDHVRSTWQNRAGWSINWSLVRQSQSHKRSLTKILKSRRKATKTRLQNIVILVYESTLSTRAGAFRNNLPISTCQTQFEFHTKRKAAILQTERNRWRWVLFKLQFDR